MSQLSRVSSRDQQGCFWDRRSAQKNRGQMCRSCMQPVEHSRTCVLKRHTHKHRKKCRRGSPVCFQPGYGCGLQLAGDGEELKTPEKAFETRPARARARARARFRFRFTFRSMLKCRTTEVVWCGCKRDQPHSNNALAATGATDSIHRTACPDRWLGLTHEVCEYNCD